VFLVNKRASFGYYKQDQTRNNRTCWATFFQKRVNIHQIHRLLFEQDKSVWFLSTKKINKTKGNAVNEKKRLKCKNKKFKEKVNCVALK